jgi:hypothetical protein
MHPREPLNHSAPTPAPLWSSPGIGTSSTFITRPPRLDELGLTDARRQAFGGTLCPLPWSKTQPSLGQGNQHPADQPSPLRPASIPSLLSSQLTPAPSAAVSRAHSYYPWLTLRTQEDDDASTSQLLVGDLRKGPRGRQPRFKMPARQAIALLWIMGFGKLPLTGREGMLTALLVATSQGPKVAQGQAYPSVVPGTGPLMHTQ